MGKCGSVWVPHWYLSPGRPIRGARAGRRRTGLATGRFHPASIDVSTTKNVDRVVAVIVVGIGRPAVITSGRSVGARAGRIMNV
jgi:hypothetical protein